MSQLLLAAGLEVSAVSKARQDPEASAFGNDVIKLANEKSLIVVCYFKLRW